MPRSSNHATGNRERERLSSPGSYNGGFHHVSGNTATGMFQQVALSHPIGISRGCLGVQTCHWAKPCHWGSKPRTLSQRLWNNRIKNPSLDRGLGCSLKSIPSSLASPRGWHGLRSRDLFPSTRTSSNTFLKEGMMDISHGPGSPNPKMLGPCFQVWDTQGIPIHTQGNSHPCEVWATGTLSLNSVVPHKSSGWPDSGGANL